jgi:hypothetical protein
MILAYAQGTSSVSPVVPVLILGGMAAVLAVVLVRTLASARSARRQLRRCPVCHGDALRDVHDERLSEESSQVSLQCGECSTWRRLVANHADFVWEVKALDRDRRLMCAEVEELGVPERQLFTRPDHPRTIRR